MQSNNKPNFLVVGSAKSGTTSLFNYLTQHSDIYIPEVKECRFFSQLPKNYKGLGAEFFPNSGITDERDYFELFSGHEDKVCGDISNDYLYYYEKSIEIDPNTEEAFGVARNSLATKYPWGVELYQEEIEHRTSDANPALTSVVGKYKISHELKDRTLDFHQNVEFKSDEENFYLVFHRWVLVNGELFREKVWKDTIPRDFQ